MSTLTARALPNGQRQLFLDDVDIAQMEGLVRTLHPLDKKGAIIRPDLLKGGHPQIRTAPIWDAEAHVWKLWVCCLAPEGVRQERGYSGYYESDDGVHWHAPIVRQLADEDGSLENNFIYFPRADGTTGDIYTVGFDPNERDASRRYKGWTYDRKQNCLVFAASPDGIRWTPLDVPTLPSYDEFNLSYDHEAQQFIATVKVNGPYGRSHALSLSKDFTRWSEPVMVFHADELDQKLGAETIRRHVSNPLLQKPVSHDPAVYGVDIYNFPVSRYENVFIAFPMMFHHAGPAWGGRNHDGFHHIQLAVSRDMKTWQRVGDRKPIIEPSTLGGGAYDLLQIVPPSYPILRGEELWFYYTGLKRRWPPPNQEKDLSAICLATLRRDGFISLDSGAEGGAVTTQPFTHSGSRFYLNGVATPGEIHCEVQDAVGKAIPGFERANCLPIAGDSTHLVVNWQGQNGLPAGPIRLHIHLRNASLYSYWVE